MAITNRYTLTRMLCGLFNLTDYVGAVISTDSGYNKYSINQLSDVLYVSEPIQVGISNDAPYNVALSASSSVFRNLQITNQEYYYIHAYSKTGSLSSIIGTTTFYSWNPYVGDGSLTFYGNNIFYFTDNNPTLKMFYNFEKNLLTGSMGNLQYKNIKVGILNSAYEPDLINNKIFSDISSNIIQNSTSAAPVYITNGILMCSSIFVFSNFPTGQTAQSCVTYLDNADTSKQYLIGYYPSTALANTPITGSDKDIYFSFKGYTVVQL